MLGFLFREHGIDESIQATPFVVRVWFLENKYTAHFHQEPCEWWYNSFRIELWDRSIEYVRRTMEGDFNSEYPNV